MKRIDHTSGGENLIGILLSISIGIALILFSYGRTNAHSTEIIPGISFISDRIRVQQIYTSQIGVREKGINAGKSVEQYLRYVNLSKGNPWCAAFVCWVLGQAGVANPRSGWSPDLFGEGKVIWERAESGKLKTEVNRKEAHISKLIAHSKKEQGLPQIVLSAYASRLVTGNWQQETGKNHREPTISNTKIPVPNTGDIFGLYFPERKRIAHVGFVDQWDGTWMVTVEGNTNDSGSREGDGVYRKRRLVRTVYKVARYVGGN